MSTDPSRRELDTNADGCNTEVTSVRSKSRMNSAMTFQARQRRDSFAAQAYTRHGAPPATPRPSQRELVAWSLLRCPDDHR
jgi:hypothetical protein